MTTQNPERASKTHKVVVCSSDTMCERSGARWVSQSGRHTKDFFPQMFGLYRQHAAAQLLPQKQQRELQREGGGDPALRFLMDWTCFTLKQIGCAFFWSGSLTNWERSYRSLSGPQSSRQETRQKDKKQTGGGIETDGGWSGVIRRQELETERGGSSDTSRGSRLTARRTSKNMQMGEEEDELKGKAPKSGGEGRTIGDKSTGKDKGRSWG